MTMLDLVKTSLEQSGAAIDSSHPPEFGPLAPATADFLKHKGPILRALLSLGCQYGPMHDAAARVAASDGALQALLATLNAGGALDPRGAAGQLLAAAAYEPLSLLFPPARTAATHPAYAAWAAAAFSAPAVAGAAAALGLACGGLCREGGQVDLRATPEAVSALADAAIARSEGLKKAGSQRDAENAVKGGGGGGGGKAAAPPAAAAAPPPPPARSGATAQPEANKALPALPPAERARLALEALAAAGVPHGALHSHAPAATVADLKAALGAVAGVRAKNLFLRCKAKAGDELWLVVAQADAKTDFGVLAKKLGCA
jgi:hypothetical protein